MSLASGDPAAVSLLFGEPFRVEEFSGRLIDAFVGMRAEVIALRLEEVGRQPLGAVTVVVAQGGAKGGHGDAVFDGSLDGVTPVRLRFADDFAEVGIENQVLQVRVRR